MTKCKQSRYEVREHCFCISAEVQHAMMNHGDVECCWCGKSKCINFDSKRVEGHGPGRLTRVRREE